jgi:hypothetical protein
MGLGQDDVGSVGELHNNHSGGTSYTGGNDSQVGRMQMSSLPIFVCAMTGEYVKKDRRVLHARSYDSCLCRVTGKYVQKDGFRLFTYDASIRFGGR